MYYILKYLIFNLNYKIDLFKIKFYPSLRGNWEGDNILYTDIFFWKKNIVFFFMNMKYERSTWIMHAL